MARVMQVLSSADSRKEGWMTRAQAFFFSLLLAVLVSAPTAAAAVAWAWASSGAREVNAHVAMWSSRTFIATFDLIVTLTWWPCVLLLRMLHQRLEAASRQTAL
jgi:hypothetical protein